MLLEPVPSQFITQERPFSSTYLPGFIFQPFGDGSYFVGVAAERRLLESSQAQGMYRDFKWAKAG
jgi:hypothetical protein